MMATNSLLASLSRVQFAAHALMVALCAGLYLYASQANAMEPMNDTEMGTVTGQEGILVSLQYYYNSKPAHEGSGVAGKGPNDIGAANGDCAGLGSENCRLALQLENRDFGWLVFKNGHASLDINRLSLDASLIGGDPLLTNGVSAGNKAIPLNAGKFQDEAGGCLLGSGNCTTAYIDFLPAVRTQYPQTGGVYTAGAPGNAGVSTGYNDVRLGVFVEGLAVEYNEPDPSNSETWAAQEGWKANNFGSFLGFEIADNAGHQAGIAIGGNFYMYGF